MSDVLSDFARVKAIFQCRAVCAAMGIMGGENLLRYKSESEAPSPTNKTKESK